MSTLILGSEKEMRSKESKELGNESRLPQKRRRSESQNKVYIYTTQFQHYTCGLQLFLFVGEKAKGGSCKATKGRRVSHGSGISCRCRPSVQ